MKKLFSLLLLIITLNVSGQKIIHNQPVSLKQVPLGVATDSVMVLDGTGATKHIPQSKFARVDQVEDFTQPLFASGQAGQPWDGDLVANLQYLFDNYQGISESGTAGENINSGQVVYQGVDNKWYLADADVLAQVSGRLAMCVVTALTGATTGVTNSVATGGTFTAGTILYLSATPGGISTTVPVTGYARIIGATVSVTQRQFYFGNSSYVNVDGSDVNGVDISSPGITKLPWNDTDNTGNYAWEVNSNPFIHNYSGNSTNAANPWFKNVFVGEDAGNYTVGDGQVAVGLGMLNVGIGSWALNSLTTGQQNNMIGAEAGALLTTATGNNGIGDAVMYYSTTASFNTAIGKNALQNLTTTDENIAIGHNAGYFFGAAGGTDKLTTGSNHVLIGYRTRPSADATTNEIAIGYDALGKGSNTAVIGSSLITKISAGADYTATADEDLVTKGHLDGVVLGTLSNVVEDLTPQLGGNLDVNGKDIDMDSQTTSIGYGNIAVPVISSSFLYFNNNKPTFRSFDSGSAVNYGNFYVEYDDTIGLDLVFDDIANTNDATISYFGLGDGFVVKDITSWNFQDGIIQGRWKYLAGTNSTTTAYSVVAGDNGEMIYFTGAVDVTITLNELTWGLTTGSQLTVVQAGTGKLTIATSNFGTVLKKVVTPQTQVAGDLIQIVYYATDSVHIFGNVD